LRRLLVTMICIVTFQCPIDLSSVEAASPLRCTIHDVPAYETKVVAGEAFFQSEGDLFAAHMSNCDLSWKWIPENDVIGFAADDNAVYAIHDVRADERGSRITALHSTTGESIWSVLVDFSAATIYIHYGVLLVQGESSIAGFDSATGQRLWKMPFVDPALGEESASGIVFVFTIENIYTDNEIKTVHAIDVHTGSELWQFTFEPALLSFVIPTSEHVVLIDIQHFTEDGLDDVSYAFDLASGELLWKVVDRQVLFLGTYGSSGYGMHMEDDGFTTIHGFNLQSGKVDWTVPSGFLPRALTITDQYIVLAAYEPQDSLQSDERTLYGIDRRTGSELWRKTLYGTLGGSDSVDGYGYFVKRGIILAIDFSKGETVWSARDDTLPLMPGQVTASEFGIVVSNSNSQSIYVFEPASN
jgi:outer membrane protein assembly factor BamB